MPRRRTPSPVTTTDEILLQVLDAQRELVTEIQGLRQALAAPTPPAPVEPGRVEIREPAGRGQRWPSNVVHVPGPVDLVEPDRRVNGRIVVPIN
jgi:hypothetical protein